MEEQGVEQLAGLGATVAVGEHVAEASERVTHLGEPQLADVARHGRLRDVAAGAAERVEQLRLRTEPPAFDQARDELLALGLRELAVGVHRPSIPDRRLGRHTFRSNRLRQRHER